jgi:hypothetical protein
VFRAYIPAGEVDMLTHVGPFPHSGYCAILYVMEEKLHKNGMEGEMKECTYSAI